MGCSKKSLCRVRNLRPIWYAVTWMACWFACWQSARAAEPRELKKGELGSTKPVHVFGHFLLCGQPSQDDFRLAKQRGFQRIITVRGEKELDWDEAKLARELGLEFHQIPIAGPDGLTDETLAKLRKLLQGEDAQKPTMLHCRSAGRVGAVWMVHRVLDEGIAIDDAAKEAKEIGLSNETMEKAARAYIAREQAAAKK